MRSQSISFNGTVTSFISSGGPESTTDYKVYIRATNEEHRVRVSNDGTMRAIGRDVTQQERDAVANFIAAEHAEYLKWKADFDKKCSA